MDSFGWLFRFAIDGRISVAVGVLTRPTPPTDVIVSVSFARCCGFFQTIDVHGIAAGGAWSSSTKRGPFVTLAITYYTLHIIIPPQYHAHDFPSWYALACLFISAMTYKYEPAAQTAIYVNKTPNDNPNA